MTENKLPHFTHTSVHIRPNVPVEPRSTGGGVYWLQLGDGTYGVAVHIHDAEDIERMIWALERLGWAMRRGEEVRDGG